MAVTGGVGIETTYNNGMIEIRNVEDAISMISPDDHPFLVAVGLGSYGSVFNKKFEWLTDELIPTIVYDDGGSGTASTVTIQADTAGADATGYVRAGDLLLNADEIMWVVAVDGESLTVQRAYAGTSADSLADNDAMYIIGNAQLESSSPGQARRTTVTEHYNITQIFSEDAEISGSEMVTDNYGMPGSQLLNDRLANRMRELMMKMERSLLYGQRNEPSDNTTARVSGGLAHFLSSYKTDLSAAALEEADIIDVLEDKWDLVGMSEIPDTILGNSWPKRKLTSWYEGRIQTQRSERVGGSMVMSIETDFGTVDYMLDRLVVPDDLFILNLARISSAVLGDRSLKEFDTTIQGKDHMARRVLGEYAWVVKHPESMQWLTNFSTTA